MSATVLDPSSRPKSIWSRLLRRDTTRFVGIDIGVDQVHVASLGGPSDDTNRSAESLQWLARSKFALPIDPYQPPGPNLVDTVCETLRECLPRCVDGERQFAAIALPLPWIHYETTPSAEIAQSRSTCNTMFGRSVFRSHAHVNDWPVCDGSSQHIIAATAENAACRVAQTIASIGYQVQSILPHGEVLIHAAEELTAVQPSVVVLLQPQGGLVATDNHGRCGMCRALPALDATDGPVDSVERIESWLETVAKEITATVRYVDRLSGGTSFNRPVLLCGDIAKIRGVDEALATLLEHPVATWQFSRWTRPRGWDDCAADITRDDPCRAVALSLAYSAAAGHLEGSR
jgi:hypothetical protein